MSAAHRFIGVWADSDSAVTCHVLINLVLLTNGT
jgi:hypothetical protein